MFLKQFRHGFATNSSSAHSVILAQHPQQDSSVPGSYEYGWQNFILGSRQEKRNYLFQQTRSHFEDTPLWDRYVALVQPDAEALVPQRSWRGEPELPGYVDHESVGIVGGATLEGIEETLQWLDHPRVVITGGNDNDTHEFNIPGVPFSSWELNRFKLREEPQGRVYFNPANGDKLHFFHEDTDFSTYIASAPELVDIKLTDWCDLACKFCYQDSTKKGQHAPYQAINRILMDLSAAGVFEVALGGGEPMAHPEFSIILQRCKELGIVPNFTTRNYEALATERFAEFAKQCGSIGVSIATPDDVAALMAIEDKITVYRDKLTLQVAMGAQSHADFQSMLTMLEETDKFSGLIMLGYKDVGRGHRAKGNRWYQDGNLLQGDVIGMAKSFLKGTKERSWDDEAWTFSMDTQMARDTKNMLEHHGISPLLYLENEGRVSCYIDAVTLRIAPSSYCEADLYRDYNFNLMDIWPEMAEDYLNKTR